MNLKVKNALISVSNKENLAKLLKTLKKFNINIISSGGTYNSIKKLGYKVKTFDPAQKLLTQIDRSKGDVIFNALHGQYGEDGYIQSILEHIGTPYTHSGPLASAIAMNKEISKKLFIKNKILTPKYIKFDFNEKFSELNKTIKKKIKYPVVIKPLNEGSSVNVFICNEQNLKKKTKKTQVL